jgi:putative transposase
VSKTRASIGFTGLLKDHKIKISIDSRGRAFDNFFVECLWRSVKYECVYLKEWRTVREASAGLGNYFEFCNRRRPHSSIAGKTPFSVHYNN